MEWNRAHKAQMPRQIQSQHITQQQADGISTRDPKQPFRNGTTSSHTCRTPRSAISMLNVGIILLPSARVACAIELLVTHYTVVVHEVSSNGSITEHFHNKQRYDGSLTSFHGSA